MKKIQSKILVFAFLVMGTFVGITSCSKDTENEEQPFDYTGVYAGTHKLEIPDNILKVLSDGLPVDTLTGLPTDLTKGFEDTLTVRKVEGGFEVTSALLEQSIIAIETDVNTVKIEVQNFPSLNLGAVVVKDASVSTKTPVKFKASGPTKVELRLKASQIADLKLNLNITTTGSFTKIGD